MGTSEISEPSSGTASDGRAAATDRTVRRQRRVWSERVDSWSQHGSVGLERVTAAVLDTVEVAPGQQVVDLGCGTGQLSLPLVERGAKVVAIDVSPAMVGRLEAIAAERELSGLECRATPVEQLTFPPASVDLIVSSYALHHLRDPDKARLVSKAIEWLRPGGTLLVADMMFGRGTSREDRAIFASKIKAFARKGPGGWWRIAKNAGRFIFRVQERPISLEAWRELFESSGFAGVTATTIVAEAGLVVGRRPS